jgi:hypothetical protein
MAVRLIDESDLVEANSACQRCFLQSNETTNTQVTRNFQFIWDVSDPIIIFSFSPALNLNIFRSKQVNPNSLSMLDQLSEVTRFSIVNVDTVIISFSFSSMLLTSSTLFY